MSTFKHIYNEKLKAIAEEEKQIDELDTKTLKSYLKKRQGARQTKNVRAGMRGAQYRIDHEESKETARFLIQMLNDFEFEMKRLKDSTGVMDRIISKVETQLIRGNLSDRVVMNRIPDNELRDMGSLLDSIISTTKQLSTQLGQIQRENPKFK